MNRIIMVIVFTIALTGCKSQSLDRGVNLKDALDMSFCESSDFSSFNPAKKKGQSTNFRCKTGLSVQLPPQTVLESDDAYVTKYYDQYLMASAVQCPEEGDKVYTFVIQRLKQVDRYSMGCTLSGRSNIEAGHGHNTFEEQFEALYALREICESDETFKLVGAHKLATRQYRYQFQCGQRQFDMTRDITPGDLDDLNALYCDDSGLTSVKAEVTNHLIQQKQAALTCQNGFHSTVQF
ncbi:hypothetical protein GAW91_000223 [Vibrio fluvialis]|nr:hypothetical protein [Vibrio fluvialis]